jgi:hypothetical protein
MQQVTISLNMNAIKVESHRIFSNPLLVHSSGVILIVIGGFGCIPFLSKLFDLSPGLILDDRGLTDNTSAFSAGFIPWSDIVGFEAYQMKNQRILYVLLKDQDKYISAFGPVRRALFKAGKNFAASPIAIGSSSISIGFDELVYLVNQHLLAYRQGS